ncbi:hypothetical protein NQ315_002534 [Exocentrus adspersus]|uniref:Uncharacterized protein n=1 Tax=Exocentrus adspersus TaxID=1586481 RepID=A0AAV8VFB8_9CUCU|nr:hypothetical protein NQ315_002534 [Exocentrus adspersus]
MCGSKMATEGLPLGRRERGASQDILAGADFLSILIKSSRRRTYSEPTTSTSSTSATLLDLEDNRISDSAVNYVRTPRETSPFAQTSTEVQSKIYDTTLVSDCDSSDSVKDDVVVTVRVTSSIDRTSKIQPSQELVNDESTFSETLTEPPTTEMFDQNFVASEDHPSIVAKASKSELSVEESEPVTKDSDLTFNQGYPARVRQIPGPSFSRSSSFSNQDNDPKPVHSTLIFHDNPDDPGRARSVSYSTVIQHPHIQNEMEHNSQQHERRERNYNGAQSPFVNNYDIGQTRKILLNDTKLSAPQSYNLEHADTSLSNVPFSTTQRNWEMKEDNYEKPTRKGLATTEQNWEMQEKPYSPPPVTSHQFPKVYGRPEQNYEVDETTKLKKVTNSTKKDDNQKVGYVVEGRNYRKYRVEERTADGFIVGEYGVVSHDDGSLRGVRYTADGTINPRLIYDALMKFLSL